MKLLPTLSVIAFLLSGCASYIASKEIVSFYTDQSPSPLTVEEVVKIAKREAKARDHFLDEPRISGKKSEFILVSANRINAGGWRAIARSSVSYNRPDGGAGAVFLNVPVPVMTIDANGQVLSYRHYSNDEIRRAEVAAAGKRR
ncbi:MAG: hypothetical protein V4689_19410 [Verrucomicrobiota bacterium]